MNTPSLAMVTSFPTVPVVPGAAAIHPPGPLIALGQESTNNTRINQEKNVMGNRLEIASIIGLCLALGAISPAHADKMKSLDDSELDTASVAVIRQSSSIGSASDEVDEAGCFMG